MKLGKVFKQPIERFSYTINYGEALTDGDNVTTVVASVEPAGLIVDNVAPLDPRAKFWVEGGTDGVDYVVTLTVGTVDGRIFQDEITFRIRER